jgi:formyltetrahydrofolate-dependent phosphoribosylglycinamide formyltransferase
VRVAIMASGAGSNLKAIIAHLGTSTLPRSTHAVVAAVISNRAAAGALAVAAEHGVQQIVLEDPGNGDALLAHLETHGIGLVALAGYIKRVPATVTAARAGRILNVHPALLPAFGGPGMYGERVHAAVLQSGARVSGVTVHFVDDQYDHGPIAAQWPVPVSATDTPATLAARVLRAEHLLYPRVITAVANGRIALDASGRVRGQVIDIAAASNFLLSAQEASWEHMTHAR